MSYEEDSQKYYLEKLISRSEMEGWTVVLAIGTAIVMFLIWIGTLL